MTKEFMLKSFDNTSLFTKVDKAETPKAVAVISHGMCEHSGRYGFVTQKLLDCGINVYRFDHRGHGRSQGERGHYSQSDTITKDLKAVVDMAAAENPNLKLFIVGYSMGGFAAADFGTTYPNKADGIILFDAATRDALGGFSRISMDTDPMTRLPNKLAKRLTSDAETITAYKADTLNLNYFTAGLCQQLTLGITRLTQNPTFNLPVFLLHGELDTLVSPKDSIEFFEAIPSKDKSLKFYGNTLHELFSEPVKHEILNDVVRWIKKRL